MQAAAAKKYGILACARREEDFLTERTSRHTPSLLKAGSNCWRIARADRAAILIDGAHYFAALRASLLRADHSIQIIGWDMHSATRLVGASNEADDDAPEALRDFLAHLVRRKPHLKIDILLWDYSLLYALEREPVPTVTLNWMTPKQISVCLDDALPFGASHHQKIVIVDDAVAFSGGIDLTVNRWDTPEHSMDDSRRTGPSGNRYHPFHDIQIVVDGEAARDLALLSRARWKTLGANRVYDRPLHTPNTVPWPDDVEPDFRHAQVGISRTMAAYQGEPEIREVETLFVDAIKAAEKALYIENQFFSAHVIAHALAERLRENPDLEVVLVGPNVHHTWLEERSMNTGRRNFMRLLEQQGVADRVALLYPSLPDDETDQGVMVHAKLMIVDNRLLRVGSANTNNRSMGLDSECDLTIEAYTDEHMSAISMVRARLLGEHLGLPPEHVLETLSSHGSFIEAVTAMSTGDRALRPIRLDDVPHSNVAQTVHVLADPERPVSPQDLLGDSFSGDFFGGGKMAGQSPARTAGRLAGAVVAIGALVAVWRYSPLSVYADPATLATMVETVRDSVWLPVIMMAAFVVGGLIVFPVTILIIAAGILFSPLAALAYALAGTLLASAVTYAGGRVTGAGFVSGLFGRHLERVRRALARNGLVGVAAVRMVPFAPFSVVNYAAGAIKVRFSDFMFGTLLGMAPGTVIITLLGNQVMQVLRDPTPGQLALLGLGGIVWIGVAYGMQRIAARLRGTDDD